MEIKIAKAMARLKEIVDTDKASRMRPVCIQQVQGKPQLVATNGKGMACIPTKPGITGTHLIPVDALKIRTTEGTLTIEENIKVQDANGTALYPHPSGHPSDYPSVENAFPTTEPATTGKVDLRLLIDTLSALLANEGNPYDGSEGSEGRARYEVHPASVPKGKKGTILVFRYGNATAVCMGVVEKTDTPTA